MAIKEVFERQGYSDINKRIIISVLILIIALILFVTIYYFTNPRKCNDINCFQQALSSCSRVSYLKEDSKAAWHYAITGTNDKNSCKVKVELLKMTQGTIETEVLIGTSMTCFVNKEDTRPPEGDMKQCTGLLKERLQEIIIDRMHSYLLKNLGEIKESFNP